MNVKQFNRALASISKLYQQNLILKTQLSLIDFELFAENFRSIIERQFQVKSGEASIDKLMLLDWVDLSQINNVKEKSHQSPCINQKHFNFCKDHFNQIFPFEKISYTVLYRTCLQGLKQSQNQCVQTLLNNDLFQFSTVISIIRNEIMIRKLKKQIIPLIQLYVPTFQKNLTLEELKDYLLIGHSEKINQINPKHVILALNGHGGSQQNLEFEFYDLKKQTNNQKTSIKLQGSSNQAQKFFKIEQIMQRLQKRVENFGKQWLVNKPEHFEFSQTYETPFIKLN